MPSLSVATVAPARRVHGHLRVPGDKSIAHRYALVAACADGASRLLNYAPGADCRSTLACLRGLGIEVQEHADGAATVVGRGFGGFRSSSAALDAGNSGTTMRMLAGILAGQAFPSTLVGDASLSRRPMRRVIEPLSQMGARIIASDGHAPLRIQGTPLRAISFEPTVPSAQIKSAVLFAGLYAEGDTSVVEPVETRDHTERALRAFGLDVNVSDVGGRRVTVRGGQHASPRTLAIPGDFSSAAFWLVAAAALPGSRIEIDDLGLNPTRTALLGVLHRFGARVLVDEAGTTAGEPHGRVVVEADRAGDVNIQPEEVPGLIDELPAIAALAAHGGSVTVRGAGELRVKESDRISVLVAGFRALGITADELPDGFTIHGGDQPSGGVADARGDHRMAMAFAIAALSGRRPSTIDGADSVAISYPAFFDTLARLVQ
jgi:3-phosphoshikimate 1-carboxyvinyltransferase